MFYNIFLQINLDRITLNGNFGHCLILKPNIMTVQAQTQQITLDAAQILTTLSQGGYQIKGIQYLYVSCSSHVISHIFRGVSIAYDRGQME